MFAGHSRSNPSPCGIQIKNPRRARDFNLVPREGFDLPSAGPELPLDSATISVKQASAESRPRLTSGVNTRRCSGLAKVHRTFSPRPFGQVVRTHSTQPYKKPVTWTGSLCGTPGGIRTPDLWDRSPSL